MNEKIPVVYSKGNVIKLDDENKWLKMGGGAIIDRLRSALSTNDDSNVLNVLIDETKKAYELSNKRYISSQDMDIAELNNKNIQFIQVLAEKQCKHPQMDVSDFFCC